MNFTLENPLLAKRIEFNLEECGSYLMGGTIEFLTKFKIEGFCPNRPFLKTYISDKFWLSKSVVSIESINNVLRIYYDLSLPQSLTYKHTILFCEYLNHTYQKIIPQGYFFSLPTELQWEYAILKHKPQFPFLNELYEYNGDYEMTSDIFGYDDFPDEFVADWNGNMFAYCPIDDDISDSDESNGKYSVRKPKSFVGKSVKDRYGHSRNSAFFDFRLCLRKKTIHDIGKKEHVPISGSGFGNFHKRPLCFVEELSIEDLKLLSL